MLRRFGPAGATDGQASTPFWFPSAEARAAKVRREARDILHICMTTPRLCDQRAVLKKYSEDRYQSILAPDQFLTNNPPTESTADSLIQQQTEKVDKIINFELVERWQAGAACLALDSDHAGFMPNILAPRSAKPGDTSELTIGDYRGW